MLIISFDGYFQTHLLKVQMNKNQFSLFLSPNNIFQTILGCQFQFNIHLFQSPKQMEEEQSLELQCTQIREISNLPKEEIVDEISKLLSSGQYQRINLLLQKKFTPSDEEIDTSSVSFIVQNDGKMKIQGNHLSKLLSKLSKFNLSNNDTLDKIRGFNKRFTKQFAENNYMGLYQYNKGNYEDAIITYENIKYIELNHQQQTAYSLNLGNCYFKIKNYKRAIDIYSFHVDQTQSDKQKAQRLNNLGSCYAKLKKYEKSLKSYTEAIQLYSKYPEFDRSNLLNNVGTLYMAVEMYKNAVKYFYQSIQLRKSQNKFANTLTTSYTKMAICLRYDERYQQAIENLLIAQNCAGRDDNKMELIYKQLALCCQKLKRWGDSLQYYQKLSNISKGQGYIFQRVSIIHKELGHTHEFQKFLKMALLQYKKQGNQRKISALNNLSRTIDHPMSSFFA